jgi:hypothetical protein
VCKLYLVLTPPLSQTRDDILPNSQESSGFERGFERGLDVTQDDLLEAREVAATLSLEYVHKVSSLHLSFGFEEC